MDQADGPGKGRRERTLMRVYSEKAEIARECWPDEPAQEGFEICLIVKLRSESVTKMAWCMGKMGLELSGWNEAAILEGLLSEEVIAEQVDWLYRTLKEVERDGEQAGPGQLHAG